MWGLGSTRGVACGFSEMNIIKLVSGVIRKAFQCHRIDTVKGDEGVGYGVTETAQGRDIPTLPYFTAC